MKHRYRLLGLALLCLCFMGNDLKETFEIQDREIAIVLRFQPKVILDSAGEEQAIELQLEENKGEVLYSGDSLYTDSNGYALVTFMDNSVAKVKPNSLLIVEGEVQRTVKSMNTRINLKDGEIFLEVQPQGANQFEVSTNRSLASVKGTHFGNTAEGYVWVEEGQVDLTAINSGQTISLFDRMFGRVDQQGNEVESGELSPTQIQNLKTGYNQLDTDMERKTMILRFRDANGQIREIEVEFFEKNNQ